MIPIAVFMVELVNHHSKTEMVQSYCSIEWCEKPHELDGRGHRRHAIAEAWTSEVDDVRRLDTGEIVATDVWSLSSCRVAGAMFWWSLSSAEADERRPGSHHFFSGPQLTVILPDLQPWDIDSRASNCTMPDDFEHRCWIRHGEPPANTVDKNGLTCAAGGGSIQTGSWHGYLRDGLLVE